MIRIITRIITHLAFAFFGFALGIYILPIITAPDAPSDQVINGAIAQTEFTGQARRDLKGSDFLHWGDGNIFVGNKFIVFEGSIAPGPDYYLYLSPEFVETESEFYELQSNMVKLGAVKSFDNFIVPVPDSVDPNDYNTVVIWCETFNEFITAAKYN